MKNFCEDVFFFFFFFFFGDRLKNFCEDVFFFFFWRALALCVLGPWPWPRAFLSLASRVSVLGKAVLGLGLGLGFFLCPWPWPRALCPRLHLWCSIIYRFMFHQRRQFSCDGNKYSFGLLMYLKEQTKFKLLKIFWLLQIHF